MKKDGDFMPKLIKEELKYEGRRFSIVQRIWEDDKGNQYIRDSVEISPASVVLPITDNNEVVFIKQFREVIGEETLELPAGVIENGEAPIHAARRELEEEAGLKAEILEPLIDVFPSAGYTKEKLYIFYAKNLSKGEQHFDDDEHITEVVKIPIEQCVELVKQGYFKQANLNLAVALYYLKYCCNK